MKRVFWIVFVCLVLIGGGYYGFTRVRAAGRTTTGQAQTAQVTRGDLQATIASAGTVQASKALDLSFGSSGTVVAVLVKPGQVVAANSPLAKLDDSALVAQVANAQSSLTLSELKLATLKEPPEQADLATAQASLDSAKANYETAKAKAGTIPDQLVVAEAALAKARRTLDEAQAAYDKVSWRPNIGMLPQAKSLQTATDDYQLAQVNYRITIAGIGDNSLRSAAAQVTQAQSALDKLTAGASQVDLTTAQVSVDQAKTSLDTAKKNLDKATLTAPFAGTVTNVPVIVGQTVGASTVAVSLADLAHLQIQANLAEVDIARVKVGLAVNITLDALPDVQLTGKVSQVALVGTSVQGVVNYPIIVAIDPTDALVKPGMSASITIIVEERTNVLLVPNRAVRTASTGRTQSHYVEVLVEGQSVQVPVTIGLSNDSMTEVTGQGLREGDTVVVSRTTTSTSGAGRLIGGGFGGAGMPISGGR